MVRHARQWGAWARFASVLAIALALGAPTVLIAQPAAVSDISPPRATFGTPKPAPEADQTPAVSWPAAGGGNVLLFDNPPDAKAVIELRGRINADAVVIGQSERDRAILGEIQNATGFRRARLGAQGTIGAQVNWVAEFDFAGGIISFKDVYIGLDQLPVVRRVRVGHQLEPFSLEVGTSANDFAFVERSPVSALDPARNWGVKILSYTDNERATFQAGAFRSGTSNNTGDNISTSNDMAYDARVTTLPWYEADGQYLLHVGGAFSQRYPFNQVVAINQGPQNSLLTTADAPGSVFLPKISIPASQQQLFNLQSALVLGPLSFQAEWNATQIDQIGGGPVFLHGAYAFASFFLTGENRQYLTKDGTFGIIKVKAPFVCTSGSKYLARGPGAWELISRFTYANFASGNIPPANGLKVGDRDAEFALGINWYLNDYTRILFNYVHAVPVDPNFGPSYANGYFLRTAIFW